MDNDKRVATYATQLGIPVPQFGYKYWTVGHKLTPRQRRRWAQKRYSSKPPF